MFIIIDNGKADLNNFESALWGGHKLWSSYANSMKYDTHSQALKVAKRRMISSWEIMSVANFEFKYGEL